MNSIIIFGLLVGSLAIGTKASGHCHSSYGLHHHDISIIDCLCMMGSNKEGKIKEKDLKGYIEDQASIISEKNAEKITRNNLTLAKGTKLEGEKSWYNTKGLYNNHPVAIRIFRDKRPYEYEVEVLAVLNQKEDGATIDVEAIGVPKVYFLGYVLGNYHAIATTLLEETLESYVTRCRKENKFSESNLLEIFQQAVEILKFFKQRNVMHRAITPASIFLKGPKVFIGDFKASGDYMTEYLYQSSRHFMKRTPLSERRDNFESLVYSIWHVAGIKKDNKIVVKRPEGEVLAECLAKGRESAITRIKEKLKRFEIEKVREAFEKICINEMLPEGNKELNYDTVIQILNQAIDDLKEESKARDPNYDGRFV